MYGKINGKQIKDTSVDLVKIDLSGGQGSFFFATGSYLGAYGVPNVPQAYITKQYADSISSGLDPKESVYLISVSNVTPFGTVSIDSVTASIGQRVLLTGQTSSVDNGIYVVGSTAWSRASDSDGDPSNEVSLGNYTFVERGSLYNSTGWLLYDTNATGSTVSVGVDTQLWTQFNAAGTFIWGDGLSNTGNNIFVDISPSGGLTFSSTQLTIANTGVSVGSYGAANTVGTFTVNSKGQLTAAADALISVPSGQITNFTASVQALASATSSTVTAGPGISVVSSGGNATVSLSPLGSTSSYGSSNTVNTFTFNNYGQLTTAGTVSISITTGQVTNFTASVQSLASTVTAGTGITVSNSGGNATVSIADTGVLAGSYGAANTINTFTVNSQGQLTTTSTQSISIVTGQITNFTASVQSSVVAGAGLTSSSGVIDVLLAKGVTFSGDYLFSDAGTILTTAGLTSLGVATNSTVQSALSAIDAALNGVGLQQEISIANAPTGTFIKTVDAPFNMIGYTFSTASDGAPHVYVNGVYVKTNSSTASVAAYFSTDGGVTANANVLVNSALFLNASVLGFKVDPTDDIVVHYLSKYP